MTAYHILSESFRPLSKDAEVLEALVRPSKYGDTIMVLPGLHVVNSINRFDLNVGLDCDL
jgi:hypothetical protein